MSDDLEIRVGCYSQFEPRDASVPFVPAVPHEKQHDIPPHCRPSETGAQCCVGVLNGRCRKCGEKVFAASNIECPAPATTPWTWRDWYDNWETHGR